MVLTQHKPHDQQFGISRKLKIGNTNCCLQTLVGRTFGTDFQVDTAPDGLCPSPAQVNVNNGEEIRDGHGNDDLRDKVNINSADKERDGAVNVGSRDNRALVDNNTAQSLMGEDIEAMRSLVIANKNGDLKMLLSKFDQIRAPRAS